MKTRLALFAFGFLFVSGAAVVAGPTKANGTISPAQPLVEEALKAEAAGDTARRAALLDEALRLDPDHQLARWQRGQIRANGKWQAVGEAQKATSADPRQAEYDLLREANSDSLDGQLGLARWCRANGLELEAKYHWTTVLSHDPQNDEAQRALGVRWYGGRHMTYAQIESAKARVRELRRAEKKYAAQVARWKRLLSAGDVLSRDKALSEIRALRDADAILAVERVTLNQPVKSNAQFEHAMQMGLAIVDALTKMPGPPATESLLRHAGISPISDVRQAAGEALKSRPQHDYVPQLLAALTAPIESSFRVATDADGSVHYWHSLYREGPNANWLIEGRSSVFQHDFGASTVYYSEEAGEVVGEERESDASVAAKKAVVVSASQTKFASHAGAIEQEVARMNQELAAANERVVPVLQQVTGRQFGNDAKAWWDWWDEHNDYYSSDEDRPTYEQHYVDNEVKYYREPEYISVSARHSCFAAGTMVWTKTGLRAIETLEIGDFVLAQDTSTGELAYKPVMGRTVRPARKTIDVRCGSEVVQATLGHPMWVAGTGWKMAQELKPGDVLHGTNGPVLVENVERAETIDVYNLIVADWHNYFVGESGVLVHDNSPRTPVTAVVPGLPVDQAR